jgi:hypothetical protein
MARPGTERPLSMKLTCRCVVPARNASSSWLTRRRPRHSRRAAARPPAGPAAWPGRTGRRTGFVWVVTQPCLPLPRRTGHSLEAVWHEPDTELRRKAVHELWAEDGAQVLQPPQEMRQAAAGLGFPSLVLRARGHEELEARVTRTYHEFIASGDYTFRSRDNADRLGEVVKFNWEMIPTGGGEVAGAGLEILVLDADGRITTDYQFIEG